MLLCDHSVPTIVETEGFQKRVMVPLHKENMADYIDYWSAVNKYGEWTPTFLGILQGENPSYGVLSECWVSLSYQENLLYISKYCQIQTIDVTHNFYEKQLPKCSFSMK